MAFDGIKDPAQLPDDFRQAADTAATACPLPQVTVTLPIDADLMVYFQRDSEPADWRCRINDLLRYFVETNLAIEADWENARLREEIQPQP